VTLKGGGSHQRRPDIVLYLNGIAIAVIELKRSSVELADGVRQLITNQEEIFNKGFFSTVQLVLAGSDSQGLRYGTTGTPEQFFVEWKDEAPAAVAAGAAAGALLDRPLAQLCHKARLLDLIRNFIIFDAGQKKVPRPHQFFGVKAAQARIARREGGVIWHTQGSGKSILMVLIAKWLLEHDPMPASWSSPTATSWTSRSSGDEERRGDRRRRTLAAHQLAGGVRPQAGCACTAPAVRADPQVRRGRPARPAAAGAWALLRLRGRVPPHPGRRHEQADEALAGGRHLHRLHRHAAAAQGQADDARRLRHLHRHLQVPPGGGRQGGAGPEIRGARRAASG
jgi:hypothetical protein